MKELYIEKHKEMYNTKDRHHIKEIQFDHHHLTDEIEEHIKTCTACRSELQLMQSIESSVQNIEYHTPPQSLKIKILSRVNRPLLSIWYTVFVAFLAVISPIVVIDAIKTQANFVFSNTLLIGISSFLGVFTISILFLLSFFVMIEHKEKVDEFYDSVTDYLYH